MSIFTIVLIAMGLAMDCFAVSVTCGAQRYVTRRIGLKMALFFGLFQGGMLLLGALLGEGFRAAMEFYSHWIAFGLLLVIGAKMVIEALKKDRSEDEFRVDKWLVLISLSIATSIDAFIVGIGLGLEEVNLWTSGLIVAAASFLMSLVGIYFGRRAKFVTPRAAELLGGLILILIGVKTLIEGVLEN